MACEGNYSHTEKEVLFGYHSELRKFDDGLGDTITLSSTEDKTAQESSKHTSKPATKFNLQALWANGGAVKLLKFACDPAAGHLLFKNYQKLKYDGLKKLIHDSGVSFLSMRDVDDGYVKVRLKTEDEVRKLFNYLKINKKYDVSVLLDMHDYQARKKQNLIAQRKQAKEAKKKNYGYSYLLSDVSNVDICNKIDSEIRFDPPSVIPDFSRTLLPKKSQIHNSNSVKEPTYGIWKGQVVIKPEVLPPNFEEHPSRMKVEENSEELATQPEHYFCKKRSLETPLQCKVPAKSPLSPPKCSSRTLMTSYEDRIDSFSSGSREVNPNIKNPVKLRSRDTFQSDHLVHRGRGISFNNSFGHASSSPAYEVTSSMEEVPQFYKERRPPPGLISIFDIISYLLRKDILNNLDNAFEVVDESSAGTEKSSVVDE